MDCDASWYMEEDPIPQEQVATQCFGCLSSNRKLSNLGDSLPVFSQLFTEQYSTLDQKVLLCWECGAQLKKVRLFKEKVENAQQQLNSWSMNQQKCLSSLIISTQVWTIGEAPQETIISPDNLQETYNKPMVDVLTTCPKTWVEDGIKVPDENSYTLPLLLRKTNVIPKSNNPGTCILDTRKSLRIEKIEQKNPNPNKYVIKKNNKQKLQIPVALPVSFRQVRKCKKVISVDPTLKNDEIVKTEVKNEILDDDNIFDVCVEACYDDKQELKDEDDLKSGQIQPKVEVNIDTAVEQITNFNDDDPIIGEEFSEDDFEWPLEEEEEVIDKTKSDKPKKKRETEKEIELTDNEEDSELEEDPDFEVPVYLEKSLNVKKSAKKNKSATSKEQEGQASETRVKKQGRKMNHLNHQPFIKVNRKIKVTMKRVTVSLLEMAALLEQDRNSDDFDKLKSSKCKKCVIVIPPGKVAKHLKDHQQKPDKSHLCNLCELRFASKEAITHHMSSSHTSAIQCSMCGYKCSLLELMAMHLWGHRQLIHQCIDCKQQYESIDEFYKHYCICDICDRPLKSKQMLIKHMYYNHLPTKCKLCGKHFKNYKTYNTHVSTFHEKGTTEDSYCVVCDKQFINRILFERHLETTAIHKDERPPKPSEDRKATETHKCPECPNTYKSKITVNEHYLYVHKQEFRHKCKLCDKVYHKEYGLKIHIKRAHEGVRLEKNKFCHICGRGFSTKRILVNHIRTHTGERPYKCDYCDSSFAQLIAMKYHIKHIHLNVKRKPYVPKHSRESQNVSSESQNYVSNASGSQNVIVDNIPDYDATYSGYTGGYYL